jgi:hypothetical protein
MPMKMVELHVLVDMREKSRKLCKKKHLQCDKNNESFTRTTLSMPKKKQQSFIIETRFDATTKS